MRAGGGAQAAESSVLPAWWAPALAPLQTVQTEELHSIRGELSQIKAQVDRLLENLECMDQQRDQLPGEHQLWTQATFPVSSSFSHG